MMNVSLHGVPETMLIPLWARAYETQKGSPLVRDPIAVDLVSKLDYDFSKFKHARLSQIGTAVRSNILDRATKAFIHAHENAVCLNLACGLDTRFERVKNGRVDWYNIDLPEGIELRERLLTEVDPHTKNIAASIFDPAWINQIPHHDRPVLILMEGASMYFRKEQMETLLQLLIEHFAPATMLMEVMPPFLIRHQKHHDSVKRESAPFQWGVERGRDVLALHPQLRLSWERTLYEGYRMHWGLLGILSWIPWVNRNLNNKILCLKLLMRES